MPIRSSTFSTPIFEYANGALLLINFVVLVEYAAAERSSQIRCTTSWGIGGSADDERGTGLVNQDGVDFVHDGKCVAALNDFFSFPRHVVAQVVEAELVVGPVRNVRCVGSATFVFLHVRHDAADFKTEESVHATHPLRVTLGEVVVHRDDVDAVASDRIQVSRQRGDESLSFTGAHLSDVAEVHRSTTHDLDVVVALAQYATRCLTDGGSNTFFFFFLHLLVRSGLAQLLVRGGSQLDAFREMFGDEQQDYGAALQKYYDHGAPADWQERYISAYASSHPWEDWAETWAHYLHIVDTLETAQAFDLTVPDFPTEPFATAGQFDMNRPPDEAFSRLIAEWLPLTFAFNSINRSMGLEDLYPFVLSSSVIDKLRFVHQMIDQARC